MRPSCRNCRLYASLALVASSLAVHGQPAGPGANRGGFGGPPVETPLVERFDRDGDKRLNRSERQEARHFLATEAAEGRGPRRPGPPGGARGRDQLPADLPAKAQRLTPSEVPSLPDAPLYDPKAVRTLFIEFESADWEKELSDFYHTDVEVPAKLVVDGKTYVDVGVRYRGASSFFTVGEGRKRSLNLSLDFAKKDQRLGGYRTLNLLNSHTDPTFLRSILYYQVAREFLPAPQANHVRVVINGENWGIYVNAEQFNADFVHAHFGTREGARWKVPGSPRGNGGLSYLGEEIAPYRRHYEIKSADKTDSWTKLIRLCRVLTETPIPELEKALEPILNLDGALRFLALENVLINCDGYWIRSSDYNLYCDSQGRFHLIPHDANETFRAPDGPGWRGGEDGRPMELSPFAGSEDANKPLLGRLLAVPNLRSRYLGVVRTISEKWLDWSKVAPLAEQYQSQIAADVRNDVHRLYSVDAFSKGVTEDFIEQGFRGPRKTTSLKTFVVQRRDYLLGLPEVKGAAMPKL
ncbi:MAG: CotH kinase family protein [Verrucomicrobiales bacterium]|nr:CotH kinase family protein [Verrucomicrobiales bacterium]